MPLYDAACCDCDLEYEYVAPMRESGKVPRCPMCRSRNVEKIVVQVPLMRMPDANWQFENNGKGRRFSQLAKHALDEDCYFRDVNSAKEEARRRGMRIFNE